MLSSVNLGDKIIAVAIFVHPNRKETATRLGFKPKQMFELSRFCICPGYNKKNLASWFISKSIKILRRERKEIKCLISFADPLFGHDGTLYKASNWKYNGDTTASYFYRDPDGYVMHKKTLYNLAISHKSKESEFASQHGYVKVNTPPKKRFICQL